MREQMWEIDVLAFYELCYCHITLTAYLHF